MWKCKVTDLITGAEHYWGCWSTKEEAQAWIDKNVPESAKWAYEPAFCGEGE